MTKKEVIENYIHNQDKSTMDQKKQNKKYKKSNSLIQVPQFEIEYSSNLHNYYKNRESTSLFHKLRTLNIEGDFSDLNSEYMTNSKTHLKASNPEYIKMNMDEIEKL